MLLLILILLFTVLPVTELAILIWLGGEIGVLQTVAIVLLTGVVGAALARHQGLMTIWRVQNELRSGQMPADALFDGALILVAGAVLLTPGILTDTAGFALLVPPLRAVVKRLLKRWFAKNVRIETGGFGSTWQPSQNSRPPTSDSVIDVEVVDTRVEDP